MNFSDEYFMKAALDEAFKALKKNEVPIGAVIVADNIIIGRGYNLTESLTDVTAHAEMQAFTAAASYLNSKYLQQATLYVTLEPCVMCAGAAYWTQIYRIVYGAADPKRGFSLLKKNILHPKTSITSGILEAECAKILQDFFKTKR